MVKKKFKYFISVVLMTLISLAFIFSTVLRIGRRDVMKASAVSVSSFSELKEALENGTDSEILVLGDIDVECDTVDLMSGKGNMKTAEIVINRSVTIKSGEGGTKTLKRIGVKQEISTDREKDGLRSMFEIIGNNVEVTFENIILDGGADFSNTTASNRLYYISEEIVSGRPLIDVCQNAILNVGEDCTIRNCLADSSISAHGYIYSTSLIPCGGAIRTDFYSDSNVDLRGGTVNLLSGSTIENCSTRAKSTIDGSALASYGGAVAAYDLGTVNMYSGAAISSCSSANGGAIGLCHGTNTPYTTGSLNMYGGAISDCHALGGGAINVGENSSKDEIKLNLAATAQTSFSNCSSTEYGGNTIYVDDNNKIYLAPYYTKIEDETEVVVGNVSIQNCNGGTAYGSYIGQLPETLTGYVNHIQFKEYQGNNTSTNESVTSEGLENVKIKIEPEDNATKYTAIISSNSSEEELQPEYKWYQSNDGTNWEEISGETSKEITISNENEKPYYKVVVTSSAIPGEVSAQTKPIDDVIQNVQVTSTTSGETGKNTYSADITYKDPENEGENVVEPKYQWYEIAGGGTPTKIDGATNKTYTPENDDGSKTYKVVVSSDYYKGTKEAQSEPSEIPPSEAVFKVGSEDSWEYYNNLSDAFLKVQEGGIYKNIIALKDYTLTSEAILYTPDINIDLQGHTISQTDSYKIRVRNTSGTVTIAGGTLIGNFDIAEEGISNNDIYLNGIVKMENFTVTGNIYNDGHPLDCKNLSCEGFVINGAEGCKCSVDGLSVTSDDIRIYDDAEVDFYNINTGADIHINNGSIAKIHSGTMNCVYSEDNSKVDILGGNENVVYSHGDSEINISGGNMACVYSENNSSINISGGVMDRVYVKDASNLKVFKEEGKDSYITNVHKDDSATGSVEISSGKFHENVKENNSLVEKYALKNIDETLNNVKYSFEVIYHPEHGHWIYSVENGGDTLKATCEIEDFDISIKLNSPENKTYNGEAISPAYFTQEEINAWSSAGITLPEITYEGTGETNYSSSTNPPVNAGTYLAKVSATGSDDVTKTVSVSFEIQKATSAAGDFAFTAPDPLVYDGNEKPATVTSNKEGIGTISVKYSTDGGNNWSDSVPKNVGTYLVGITTEGATNYENITTPFTVKTGDNKWEYSVTKATPEAGDFTFTAPDPLVYDGNTKTATVTAKSDVNGMGEVIIHYYSDESRTVEVDEYNVRDAGTYYVGVTVSEGDNYSEQNTVIYDDTWHFEIEKAEPTSELFNTYLLGDENYNIYDGRSKFAGCEKLAQGIGDLRIVFSSDANNWDPIGPINVGTYHIGIETYGGKNYKPSEAVLTKTDWDFEIVRAKPTSSMFNFSADDVTYNRDIKEAQVAFNEKYNIYYPDVVHTGMGDVTVHYYENSECTYEISKENVKDAGTYYVGITVSRGANYFETEENEVLKNDDWKFTINKADPVADNFEFKAPSSLIYGEGDNHAKVETKEGVTGMGNVTVKYFSDAGCTSEVEEVLAGEYFVGIMTEEGDNYNASTSIIHNSDWNFVMQAYPAGFDYIFSAPEDLVYNGENKTALVKAKEGVEGTGDITVHYFSDPDRRQEVNEVKDAGLYYVGITTTEGEYYLPTKEGEVLFQPGWQFEIQKAEPILDFNIISGGTTGEEAQLQTKDKKELFYGKTLETYKDILPESGVGNFSFKDKSKEMQPVGDQYIDLVFTPNDTKNYDWTKVKGYNPETEKLDLKLLVSIVVDKSDWGDKVNNDGTENYVDNKNDSPNKGSTSVEITGDGIHWVKEQSKDADTGEVTSAWYGIDNSKGVFEKGSRFLVRWINKAENPDEWAKYHPMLDSKEVQNMPDKKKWIFIAEVIHPDGTHKYEKLEQPVPLYVQLGDDWDIDDVEAYFLSQGDDERLSKQYMGEMDCPEGKKRFFKLELLHFSPYTIYDVDPVSSNNGGSNNVNPKEDNNGITNPNNNSSGDDGDYYTKDEYSENEGSQEDNSKNKINENEDGGKSTPVQEKSKGGINPWYIAAGIGLLGLSLLLGYLLYKKRKKEKEVLMYSLLAQVGKSSTSA